MKPNSRLMRVADNTRSQFHRDSSGDEVMTGIHVLGTWMHGMLHARCVVRKPFYVTGEHEVEDLSLCLSHGDVRQGQVQDRRYSTLHNDTSNYE